MNKGMRDLISNFPLIALRAHFVVLALVIAGHGESRGATVLAAIGDYGERGDGGQYVANMVASNSWQTEYVVTLGDNNSANVEVGAGDWEEILGARYGQFMKARSGPAPNPYPHQTSVVQRFFPIVGDHDIGLSNASGISGYVDYFHTDAGSPVGRLPAGIHTNAESYYDFELPIQGGAGSIRIFAMDSESYATSEESRAAQIGWLRDGLRGSDATWNFVVAHRPPFSSGLHNSDPSMQLPFQQWGADAVLSGHDHLYERLRVTDGTQNQMLYIVNGLGGANNIYPFMKRAPGSEVRYNWDHGAMRIAVTDEEAKFEFFAVELGDDGTTGGTLIDSITLTKSAEPLTPAVTADFNQDGFVDEVDLSIWRAAAGVNGLADANKDGMSDGMDLLAWQRQRSTYRPEPAPAAVVAAVPEPSACLIAALAVMGLIASRSHGNPSPARGANNLYLNGGNIRLYFCRKARAKTPAASKPQPPGSGASVYSSNAKSFEYCPICSGPSANGR
jgi:hypothetical protein